MQKFFDGEHRRHDFPKGSMGHAPRKNLKKLESDILDFSAFWNHVYGNFYLKFFTFVAFTLKKLLANCDFTRTLST